MFRLRPLTKKKLIESLHRYRTLKRPVHRWLKNNLEQVEMLSVPDNVLLEAAHAEYEEEGEGTVEARVDAYREMIRWLH
jgi:hypothetical protein